MSKKASKNVTAASAKAGAPAHVAVARLPKVCNKFHLDVQPRFPADASLEDCTIFTVPALLTSSECQTLLAYIHANHALERVAHAQTKSIAWRNVDRVEFRSLALSELVWGSGLGTAVASSVALAAGLEWAGLNPKWRIYRYCEGQGFGPHYDEEDIDAASGATSHYTLLLYLSDVAAGGETVFYASKGSMRARDEALAVRPAAGLPAARGAARGARRRQVVAAQRRDGQGGGPGC